MLLSRPSTPEISELPGGFPEHHRRASSQEGDINWVPCPAHRIPSETPLSYSVDPAPRPTLSAISAAIREPSVKRPEKMTSPRINQCSAAVVARSPGPVYEYEDAAREDDSSRLVCALFPPKIALSVPDPRTPNLNPQPSTQTLNPELPPLIAQPSGTFASTGHGSYRMLSTLNAHTEEEDHEEEEEDDGEGDAPLYEG
ncbi:hypothetical protein T484DRAFT_3640069, partial [Baffinella frigidus]